MAPERQGSNTRAPGRQDPTPWRRDARDPTPWRRDDMDAIGLDDAVRRHRMYTAGVERQSGRPDVKGPDDGTWEPGIETMAF
ncbi:hypothetical protein BGX38DRAFT_1272254 [Terfezia claveryi]|nr:hypothetical protein BGX38DRAFT_1272254 [Terfezia claveryi]